MAFSPACHLVVLPSASGFEPSRLALIPAEAGARLPPGVRRLGLVPAPGAAAALSTGRALAFAGFGSAQAGDGVVGGAGRRGPAVAADGVAYLAVPAGAGQHTSHAAFGVVSSSAATGGRSSSSGPAGVGGARASRGGHAVAAAGSYGLALMTYPAAGAGVGGLAGAGEVSVRGRRAVAAKAANEPADYAANAEAAREEVLRAWDLTERNYRAEVLFVGDVEEFQQSSATAISLLRTLLDKLGPNPSRKDIVALKIAGDYFRLLSMQTLGGYVQGETAVEALKFLQLASERLLSTPPPAAAEVPSSDAPYPSEPYFHGLSRVLADYVAKMEIAVKADGE